MRFVDHYHRLVGRGLHDALRLPRCHRCGPRRRAEVQRDVGRAEEDDLRRLHQHHPGEIVTCPLSLFMLLAFYFFRPRVHNSNLMAGQKFFVVPFKGQNLHVHTFLKYFFKGICKLKSKILGFAGQINSLRGPHLAREPYVVHVCFIQWLSTVFSENYKEHLFKSGTPTLFITKAL